MEENDMIYTEMTVKAMQIAYKAHADQVDYNNVPYIFHPYHLAEQMDDEISCTAALLHDVVEDTNLTIEDLEQEFPKGVTEIVKLLTHEENVDYFDYIRRIKTNPIATKVKLEDLKHNSDKTRNVGLNVPEEKLRYWEEKYTKAKELLLQ